MEEKPLTDKIALLKQRAQENIEALADQLWDIALEIHTHPELGLQEKRAAKALTDALVQAGFSVFPGTKELETSFVGRIQGSQSKPVVALLCEYDALPELGHACGHNLIGTASVGAGMALAPLMSELPGTLLVVGAPGEETYAGKAQLVDAGVFDGVDAAMMFHPSAVTQVGSSSYALDALEFVFTGRAAHAASSPEKGINALDGAIFLFNGINALREHLPDDVRIHGIISEGGVAPNVVPERAAARFYFRSARRRILDEILVKVKRIAQGAAMMSGTEVTWHNFEPSNDNLVTNRSLAAAFTGNLQALGVTDIIASADGKGSTDMGNVSHVAPAIHPYISLGIDGLVGHTPEFAAACASPNGRATMLVAAKALAMTAIDFLCNPSLQQRVREEFQGWTR